MEYEKVDENTLKGTSEILIPKEDLLREKEMFERERDSATERIKEIDLKLAMLSK